MAVTNPLPRTLINPVLLDLILSQVNARLMAGLPWLSHAYGKVERKERFTDAGKVFEPVIFAGGQNYLCVLPDAHLGTFSFVHVEEIQEMKNDQGRGQTFLFECRASIILWFDYRTVYGADADAKSIEHVKLDVLNVLNAGSYPNGRFTVLTVEEGVRNVYREYSVSAIDNEFETRPFGCLRINGELMYTNRPAC